MLHEKFIRRCFDLAQLGRSFTAPNPVVGAVLVYNKRIIGEGYHQAYGTAHAEVNTLASVQPVDRHLISQSTLYISLEPCCIHGNTPPCTDLIIGHKIPKVVFSTIDHTATVSGQSIRILENAGVAVITGVLDQTGAFMVRARTILTTKDRPFVILKFALSKNNFLGVEDQQIWLSNAYTKRLVHRWRSDFGAILIGTKTAETDDPQLNNRLFFGPSPLRVVLDKSARLNHRLQLFNDGQATWVITEHPEKVPKAPSVDAVSLTFDQHLLNNLLRKLKDHKITKLLVEGGGTTLQSFLDQNLWDEARVFHTEKMLPTGGIPAPNMDASLHQSWRLVHDELALYLPKK